VGCGSFKFLQVQEDWKFSSNKTQEFADARVSKGSREQMGILDIGSLNNEADNVGLLLLLPPQ
jgi:hypothetical protein